jgi:hypothetical protein
MRKALLLSGLLSALWLCACGDAPAPVQAPAPPPASAPTAAAPPAGPVVAAGDFTVTLVGEPADAVLRVQRLEIRRAGKSAPLQVIDGLQTETPSTAESPGLEAVDLDFDGHLDLRLVEARAAGPQWPRLHWLYVPASGRFVASPALDELSPTRIDAVRRELVTEWRDGPDRYGTDVHAWREGSLVRLERREGPGR